ncbi:MAG: PepSY-associated TM helix domain-containing protein [Candidatus Ferrigenium altingense]
MSKFSNSAISCDGRWRFSLKNRRKLWLQVHLWVGLMLGVVLAITGITGSILVFPHEIDELLNPSLMTVVPNARGSAAYRPIDEIAASAKAAVPSGSKFAFAYYPRNDAVAFSFRADVPVKIHGQTEPGWEHQDVFINPYDATFIGSRVTQVTGWSSFLPRTFIGFVFTLHYALLLPDIGGTVVGICAIFLCFSLLTGLILWWPLDRKWKRVLTIKRGASLVRFNHDLHQSIAFYTLPVIFAVLFSGIYMVLPTQFMALLHAFSPDAVRRYEVAPVRKPGAKLIGLESALKVVQTNFPDARPFWLYMPNAQKPRYMICQQEGARTHSYFIDRRCAVLDGYSGAVMHVEEAGVGTAGDTFIAWQWPLHSGYAFGWTGRILVFLCGLACPVIFATGVIRWLQKRRSKRAAQERHSG